MLMWRARMVPVQGVIARTPGPACAVHSTQKEPGTLCAGLMRTDLLDNKREFGSDSNPQPHGAGLMKIMCMSKQKKPHAAT